MSTVYVIILPLIQFGKILIHNNTGNTDHIDVANLYMRDCES